MRRLLCLLLALWVAVSLSPAFGASKLLTFGSGGIKPLVSYDLTASNTLPAGISYSATSLRTVLDSNGFITYAPNEQFLNNASPATQNVTTKAGNYVLWCNSASTGTITLTGTSTAGPLTCTTSGANLAFTPTAGTLTLTIGGTSVTRVVLAQVTYETTLRPQDNVTVTSSAYYGPAFDSNYPSAGYQGLRIWQSYTNVDLWNRDLTNAVWTATNITAAHNQTGIDGVANSASSLTATANNGTICQPITLASSQRQQAIYVERLTGTGAVSLSMDGGATYTALTVTVSWSHKSIPSQTLANPQTCIKLATSGDSIAVDGVQNDNASAALAPVAFTTSAAVAVAADLPQATGTLAACYKAASESLELEFTPGTLAIQFIPWSTSTGNRTIQDQPPTMKALDLSSSPAGLNAGGGTIVVGVPARVGISATSSARSIALNGTPFATDSHPQPSGSAVTIGSFSNSDFLDGYIRKIACWSPALPNSILQQKSTVGPGPITWNLPPSQNFLHDSDTGSQILNSDDGLTPIMVN